ncbi:DUF2254 domain-containing protein [Novosphingobium sp. 9]|uniref:DUF2254 domain-containing protein n=1 Tax=Novosphingobium sp. 9 TaxID=2025349 RepID=UPI0021B66E48|nr:DUF2254 domain-containing protein [Novosphingobium sp. 9]
MIASLRSNWFAIRASYWFYPALFAIAALVLAQVLVHADRVGAAEWISRTPWLTPARPDGASNMLSVLASAMIGIASTVFSITIAAVAYVSGTYGPRLLTNFMEDRGNQLSLATFVGTFVYAICVLRAVRAEDEQAPSMADAAATHLPGFVPQLSLLVGFALMIVAVGVLVYFLHHVPSSIRINTVLENIGERLMREIAARFPHEGAMEPQPLVPRRGLAVRAKTAGYIRLIELGALADIAGRKGLHVQVRQRVGDFVHPGIPLLEVEGHDLDEQTALQMRGCFAFGGARTPEQDLEFSIDELVEIALRALSPAVNDPFTAITATHWLSATTAEFGRRNLRIEEWHNEDGNCPVELPPADFAHFLERGFIAARTSFASTRQTALVAMESLAGVAQQVAGAERRARVIAEIEMLASQAIETLPGFDAADVRRCREEIRARLCR